MTVVDGALGESIALPRELTSLVGRAGMPAVREVRADEVRRFLLATVPGATGPEGRRESPSPKAGDVVPPTFFCPDPIVAAEALKLPRPRPYQRNIDGGSEWEVRRAVRVGDVLTLVPRIAAISGRMTGDRRRMVTTVIEVGAWDRDGTLVGLARGRCLSYEDRAR
jgi:hypothetical protein